jgi:ABC-type multidrug transport system fused ATPase/permease subunit
VRTQAHVPGRTLARSAKSLWPVVRSEQRGIIVLMALSALAATALLLSYLLLGRSVAALRQIPTPHRQLLYLALAIAGAGVSAGVLTHLQNVRAARLGVRLTVSMQERVYAQRAAQDLSRIAFDPSGRTITSILYDLQIVPQFLISSVTTVAASAVTGVAVIGAIVYFDYRLLVLIFVLGLIVIPLERVQRILRSALVARISLTADLQIFMDERLSLPGIKFSRSFGLDEIFLARFRSKSARVQRSSYAMQRATSLSILITGLANTALVVLVLTFANWSSLGHDYRATADLVLVILSAPMLVQVLLNYSNLVFWVSTAAAIVDFLQLNSATAARPLAGQRTAMAGAGAELAGAEIARPGTAVLRVRDLCFDYRAASFGEVVEVIRGMTFDVLPGESLAIVGSVGSGKSTLALLLAGLLSPSSGCVELPQAKGGLAGRCIRLVDNQDCFIGGSVQENLQIANSSLSLKQIVRICESVGIHKFVSQLPRGYQTSVGERGAYLSSGQRQLLAIARAVAAQPQVVILDEATTGLDAAAELRAIRGMRELLGCSVVLIAHRLSSIVNMDRIVVIGDGRVVAIGHHAELLATSDAYQQLCELQLI